MRPLTLDRWFRAGRLKAASAATVLASLLAGPALAACPWTVQPSDIIGGDRPDYEIAFNGGADPSLHFYGFTVTDHYLAWELSSGSGLETVDRRVRPLETIDDDDGLRYRTDPDSVLPLTLYLVVATKPVAKLDRLAAAFEPARPVAVGLRTRGASDSSGPLPHQSLPGIEIHYASHQPEGTELGGEAAYQVCAYQVLFR